MLECLDSIYREYECVTLWRDASGRSCLRGTKGQTVPLLLCDSVSGLGQRVGEFCLDLEWITHTIKFLSEQQQKGQHNFPRQEDNQMESNYFSPLTPKFEMRMKINDGKNISKF